MNNENLNKLGSGESMAGETDELLQLRSEIRELRQKLEQSKITSEKVLRKVMRGDSSWLNKFVMTEIISLPFITLIFAVFSYGCGASLWPVLVYFVIACVSVWFDRHTLSIATSNILTMPMTELREELVKQKRDRMIQTIIETPLTIGWIIWYYYSIKVALSPDTKGEKILSLILTVSLVVGVIVGLIVVWVIYKKAQKTNNSLIDSIDASDE